MDKKETQKTRKLITILKVLRPRDIIDYKCQEKEEGEDLPALKMHQYEDSRTTLKRAKENKLQRPITAVVTLR